MNRLVMIAGLGLALSASAAVPLGTLRGTVEHMLPGDGIVMVRAGDYRLAVHGLPSQLMAFVPGDSVQLPYREFGTTRWLPLDYHGGVHSLIGFSAQGAIAGTVQAIDRPSGRVTIGGARFRVHPELLGRLRPDELVEAHWANISGKDWITQIRPAVVFPAQLAVRTGCAVIAGCAARGAAVR